MDTHNPIDVQGQERAQLETAQRAQSQHDTEVEDVKWLMSNKRGRRFVFRLLERAGVWRLSFDTNALSMAFKEGTRNEGLRLMSLLNAHCADRYTTMMQESREP